MVLNSFKNNIRLILIGIPKLEYDRISTTSICACELTPLEIPDIISDTLIYCAFGINILLNTTLLKGANGGGKLGGGGGMDTR